MFKYLRITLTGPGRCLKRPLWRGITAHLRHMQQSDNHSGGAATAAIYPNPGLVPVFFAAEQISTPRYIPRPSSETGHAKASRRAYTYECTCSFHFFALSCVLFSGLPLFPWPPPTSPVDFKCQADLISLAPVWPSCAPRPQLGFGAAAALALALGNELRVEAHPT